MGLNGVTERLAFILLFSFFITPIVFADPVFFRQDPHPAAPDCLEGNSRLPINTEEVLAWKRNSPNQFQDRGNVWGVVSRSPRKKGDHDHFILQIGPSKTDHIEIVYNTDFGRLPQIDLGFEVQACGDYITSNKPAGHYAASPAGAILHWVHAAVSGSHESGFLIIDGKLYGTDTVNAKPKTGRRIGPNYDSTSWFNFFGL